MPVPPTLLEKGFGWFFRNPVLNTAVRLERMFAGGGESAAKTAWYNKFAREVAMPSRSYINMVTDAGEKELAAAIAQGKVEQGAAGWASAQLRAARVASKMTMDHAQTRRIVLNQADDWVNDYLARNNLTREAFEGEPGRRLRRMVESGDLRDPAAAELDAIVNRPWDMSRAHFTAAESELSFNRFPVMVDAAKVTDNPLAFQRVTDALATRVMQRPDLQSLLKEALVKPQTANLLHHEVSDAISDLIMQEARVKFRPVQGYVRSPARLFARRLASEVPEEWRMSPWQEMMSGLHDEYSFAVDSKIFGRGGKNLHAIVDFLQGRLRPEDYANLPKESLEELQRLRTLGIAEGSSGPLQRELGGMVERLARATTGTFDEPSWVWAIRNGFAPAGVVSMMAFSAIPNLGQSISEFIIRGWGPVQRGFIGQDKTRARLLAIFSGQHNASTLMMDWHHGVPMFTESLVKTKGPGALLKGELPSLGDPRWYWDNYKIILKYGVRGMRASAEEFLTANGFSGVEDWLRRGSVLAVEQEIGQIQRLLASNPTDARALRRMASFGFDDPQQFMQIRPPDLAAHQAAFRSGDLTQALEIKDWQRAYFHGVGETQFNYLPGDFPMMFAHPLMGSVMLQFRRYSYSQATKVVSSILNEASAGNFGPLLRAAATIPTGGEIIRRARDLIQAKDVAFVGGKPVFAERPTIERGKEARIPLIGGVMSPDQRRMMENTVAMGLMGLYSDAFWSFAEDKPLLTASFMAGIFPSEVFNFVSKLAAAGSEVVFGPEPGLGYGRVGGPKVQEAVRQTVREFPFAGRIVSPHVRWGRSKYEQLREHGMRLFLQGDLENFNRIQTVLTDEFYAPITIDDIVGRAYRQALKEAGYSAEAPRPGDPGYPKYQAGKEAVGERRRRTPVTSADRPLAMQRAQQRTTEFFEEEE